MKQNMIEYDLADGPPSQEDMNKMIPFEEALHRDRVAMLVPTQSDADVAAGFKKEAETALLGLCKIMDRANRAGFVLQFQLGTVPPGKNVVSTLFLAKHY